MVEIDPKSLETKSLKISASEVLHNKRYSNLKNRGGDVLSPPRDWVVTKYPVMSRVKYLSKLLNLVEKLMWCAPGFS